MALIILEGLDRTGKSTVAKYYETQGYELIHQSAPPKGQTADMFLEEMMQLVSSAAHKDIVLDRSYYGELVWPDVYHRPALLSEEGLEMLEELEDSVGTTRILMHDPNVEAHWKRCVDNKEPLTRAQFAHARQLFNVLVSSYRFERKTLNDYTDLIKPVVKVDDSRNVAPESLQATRVHAPTKEQQKLEVANAINDILSKRILKSKGAIYDQLEDSIRTYLNAELAKIFGSAPQTPNTFNDEEVELLKFFCANLKKKAGQ